MKCLNCEGRGRYPYREGQPYHYLLNPWFRCHVCKGTGTR